MDFILFAAAATLLVVGLAPALQAGNIPMVLTSGVGLIMCAGIYYYSRRLAMGHRESPKR